MGRVPPPARSWLGLGHTPGRRHLRSRARVCSPGRAPVRTRRPVRRQDAGELPARRLPRRALSRSDLRLPRTARSRQRELADGGLAREAAVRPLPPSGAAHRPRRAERRSLEPRARAGLARPSRGSVGGDLRAAVRRLQRRRSRGSRCASRLEVGRRPLRGSRGRAGRRASSRRTTSSASRSPSRPSASRGVSQRTRHARR